LARPDLATVAALELRPVSSAVNSVRNNGPELLERFDPQPEPADLTLFDTLEPAHER
jgi:hypothetical protein